NVDFGRTWGDQQLNVWDAYHYFIGAKYFPELRYSRIYACTAAAEGAPRRIRNFKTGLLERADVSPAAKQKCRARFSKARWNEFVRDTAFFRGSASPNWWRSMLHDQGFNASVVWLLAGHSLTRSVAATDLSFLLWLDVFLLMIAVGALYFAFGLRQAAVAALFYSVFPPCAHYFVGGSILRMDWLAATAVGLALLRVGRPALAGAAIAYAGLLRLFPFLLFTGVLLKLIRGEGSSVELRRFFLGAFITTVGLVAAGAIAVGPRSYTDFADHISRFESRPLTNQVGLRTALAHPFSKRVEQTRAMPVDNHWEVWAKSRQEAAALTFWVRVLILAVFGWMFWMFAVERVELWKSVTLGLALIPLLADLPSYYTAYIALAAVLIENRPTVEIGLLLLAVGAQVLALTVFWTDDRYAWISMVTVVWAFTLPWSKDL
ncbi:MAG: hypothetical protein AAF449_13760, partial [Myxococcota bacterium]